MEIKLLEDLITLSETKNFRRAAQLRHISESAFSRRIKSLEAWAGTPLVKRSAQAVHLTPAGWLLRWKAADVLSCLLSARAHLNPTEEDRHASPDVPCAR